MDLNIYFSKYAIKNKYLKFDRNAILVASLIYHSFKKIMEEDVPPTHKETD